MLVLPRFDGLCCCLLLRQDLKETFIDSGVMSAIKEWISPLPDKSLPALRIREELLRILQEVRTSSLSAFKLRSVGLRDVKWGSGGRMMLMS